MSSRIPFTAEEDAIIAEMWSEGIGVERISIRLMRARRTVAIRAAELCLPKRPRQPPAARQQAWETRRQRLIDQSNAAAIEMKCAFPKPNTTMHDALKGRTYGKPRAGNSTPINGARLWSERRRMARSDRRLRFVWRHEP